MNTLLVLTLVVYAMVVVVTAALTNTQALEKINLIRKKNSLPLVQTNPKVEELAKKALEVKAYVNSFQFQGLMKKLGLLTNSYSLSLVSTKGGEVQFLPELVITEEFDLMGYAESESEGLLVMMRSDKSLNLAPGYIQEVWAKQVGGVVKVEEGLNKLAEELTKGEEGMKGQVLKEKIKQLYPNSKGLLSLSAIGLSDKDLPIWLHENKQGLAQCKQIGLSEVKPNGFLLLGVVNK